MKEVSMAILNKKNRTKYFILKNYKLLTRSEYIEFPKDSGFFSKLRSLLKLAEEPNYSLNKTFDSREYLENNYDIRQNWDLPAFLHFVLHGYKEGRTLAGGMPIQKTSDELYLFYAGINAARSLKGNPNRILYLSPLPTSDGVIRWRIEFQKAYFESQGKKVDYENYLHPSINFENNLKEAGTIIIVRPSENKYYYEIRNSVIASGKDVILDLDDLIFDEKLVHLSGGYLSGKVQNIQILKDRANFMLQEIATIGKVNCSTVGLVEQVFRLLPDVETKLLKNNIPSSYVSKFAATNKNDGDNSTEVFKILIISGTFTHNHDCSLVYCDLLNFLIRHEDVTISIMGRCELFKELPEKLAKKITRLEYSDYDNYVNEISHHDLVCYPLDKNQFNECKSNIKYLEAALTSTPILVSKLNEFISVIKNGENGFFFEDSVIEQLEYLYKNRSELKAAGSRAYQDVLLNSIKD